MVPNIAAAVIKLGQQKKNDELKEILERIPTKELVDLVSSNIGGADGFTLWHFVLLGMTHSSKTSDKRFQITMAVLQQLNRVELATKVAFDIVSRLVLDLPKFGPDQLVEILEYCVESIRAGDPKCMGWKDLLPDVLSLLSQQVGRISVNGFIMTGVEYRKKVLDELFKMKIQNGILTSFTGMFREVQLSKEEATLLVGKVCDAIRHLEALEIPALTFQLFHVCLKYSSLLVLPIYSLQKYFHKHYYKRIASNDCGDSTDFDSIEPVSDKELREAEETILYHLSNVTEFRLDEAQVVAMFKPFQNMPEFLLTPFVISALIAMSKINRTPDTMKVVSSHVMAFLVRLVAENEHERELCQRSAWCRGRIDSSGVPDVNRILTILTEHSQEGMEVVTPGVIHFGFALLIAKKQPKLHTIAIAFLQNFIKKRFIFGNGIVDKLKQYLFVELEAMQFSECLITLSLTSALTLSECGSSISYILEYLLLIDGYHAMRIITFLFPLIRISHTIRDAFIEVLRKAMHHSETRTRMMGVFGFCALLKQLKNNNSRRAVLGGSAGNLTQLSISGMSLLSQSTLGRADNPDVHFDMLTLEILGILRRCFTQTVEIRELLYESLGRAVEFNGKLLPHVLQFVDWHFNGYFGESLDGALEIDFEKCVRYRQGASEDVSAGDQQLEVYDNVGKLTAFMVHCMTLADQQQDMGHDCDGARKLLEDVVNKIDGVTLDSLGIIGTLDPKTCVIACHYLNTVEAGMSYCIWKTKPENGALRDLLKLFKHHQSCSEKIKKMEPKKAGRKAANNETIASTAGPSSAKSLSFRPENVWDLATVERLLRIVFDDSTAYATEEDLEALRSNRDFTQFVLRVATEKLEALRTTPEYWQIKHSKRIFHHLCECGKIAYDRCVKRTNELCSNGNVQVALAAVECFRQALLTALAVYERKFVDFLRMISCSLGTAFRGDLLQTLHGIVDRFLEDGAELEVAGEKTIHGLLVCLEILYTSEGLEITHLNGAYSWLQDFCVNHKLKVKSLGIVHRILFDLRLKTQTGAYFDTVSMLVEKKYGQIHEEELAPSFALKSISSITVESALMALCSVTKQQLDDVEHFVLRTNSVLGRLKIYGQGENDEYLHQLKTIERSMCSQLVHIMSVATHLANTQLTLGACMDALLKLLISLYGCLTNLAKHFITRHAVAAVSHDSTKFNLVIKSSKSLAEKIYLLFPHIEENILGQSEEGGGDDEDAPRKSTTDAKRNREKVLRQTKLIPKVVFRIETFNKFVLLLSKKTKKDLTYLLHLGTVRDFRIREPALVEAIRKVCDGQPVDETTSEFGDLADLDAHDEDEDGAAPLVEKPSDSTAGPAPSKSIGVEESQLDEQESNTDLTELGNENLALKNLALLNEKSRRRSSKKRKTADATTGDAENAERVAAVPEVKKRKVGGGSKKGSTSPKINKRALETMNEVAAPLAKVTTTRTLGPKRSKGLAAKKAQIFKIKHKQHSVSSRLPIVASRARIASAEPWTGQDQLPKHQKRSNQSQTRHALLDLRRQAIPLERQRQVLYELVQQLERSPSEKAFAVQEGAIELLKELRHSPDPAIVDSARLGLTLLGYVGPLPGQGIRILSIDGGGIRGLIVMELLRKLEKMTNRRIFDLFDIVCGVSAGANLVCALASEKNVTLDECIHLYKKTSHTIFHRPSTLDKLAGASRLVSSHAYYDAEMWEGLLKKHVGYWRIIDTSKLTHVPKICCVSTTICDQHIDAHVFRNYTFPLNVQSVYAGSHTARLWEVVRASTAAPAYFGDFQLEGQLHQDGGILYNNPTTVAIHEAKCLWPNERIQCVVSLGTGRTRTKPSEGKDGRKIVSENFLAEASLSSSWKTKFLRILDSATDTEATHTILSDLLPPGRYFRFNPYLTEFLSMVEVRPEKIAQLERDTNEYFKRNEDKFELVAEHLTRKRNIVHQTYDALRDAFR